MINLPILLISLRKRYILYEHYRDYIYSSCVLLWPVNGPIEVPRHLVLVVIIVAVIAVDFVIRVISVIFISKRMDSN